MDIQELRHTPEPWEILGSISIWDGGGNLVADLAYSDYANIEVSQANARRIVACVNACAGIRTDSLEKMPQPFKQMLDESYLSLAQQRDELMAAIRAISRTARLMHTEDQHETICVEPQHWRALMEIVRREVQP